MTELYAALHNRLLKRHSVIEDHARKPWRGSTLLLRINAAARALRKRLPIDGPIGVLLPTSIATATVFMALNRLNRTIAMLNTAAGAATILSACTTACVQTVVTSQKFIEAGKLQAVTAELQAAGITLLLIDELPQSLSWLDKAAAAAAVYLPAPQEPKPAPVILFTSGSEGAPKGVVLSSKALLANVEQVNEHFALRPDDVIFNALPLFHAFGLTAGLLLPLLSNLRVFLYPSPLHYKVIPTLLRGSGATIFLSTDTLLRKYAEHAATDSFAEVRLVVAGAEKVHESTRLLYDERFAVPVLQGYGVTEAAPVLACNTLEAHCPGSVGRLLPRIDYRLKPVEGVADGGRLEVRGANLMDGYMLPENPGVLRKLGNGFYDTGDIARVDELGFVHIIGRAKRFAKIAGEMVSLSAVEEAFRKVYPDCGAAAVNLPDPSKGERIMLLTDCPQAERAALIKSFAEQGISALHVPHTVRYLAELPLTGSGKIDYVRVGAIFTQV